MVTSFYCILEFIQSDGQSVCIGRDPKKDNQVIFCCPPSDLERQLSVYSKCVESNG